MTENTNREDLDLSLKMFIVLSRASRAVSELVNKSIQSYGLNPTEFAVLELLYHKGDQPLQQIGGKILLTSGSITYVIDKLEKKEYITRRACSTDRRVTYGSITEKGRQLINNIFPDHEKRIHEITGGLTSEEKKLAITYLKKLGYHAKEQE